MKNISITLLILLTAFNLNANAQEAVQIDLRTKVILLGTGNPNPDPGHSGCSVAIVVDETPYIIDFGPGVVRQAAALSPRYGGNIPGLDVKRIKRAFLTHLHSDHTTGYPDLIFTPWVMGRDEPLEVYGPEGIKKMTAHILEAYGEDIRYRLYGLEPANNQGWRVNAHEIEEGEIYRDSLVRVEAFHVMHGSWPNAFGYRFTTPDRVIVISGDTRPCENIIEYAKGADVLVHEAYSQAGWEKKDEFWKKYHKANHTSTLELGGIAAEARPGLVIMYHTLYWGADDAVMIEEFRQIYDGKVIVGKDLGVY